MFSFSSLSKDIPPPLKLITDKSMSMEMVIYAVLRRVSQPVVVWTPSFIDVVKGVRNPLLLEHSVALLTDVERFASPATQTKDTSIKGHTLQPGLHTHFFFKTPRQRQL